MATIRRLIDEIGAHEPQDFIAPVLSKQARVFTMQSDIPYWFDVSVERTGWYSLRPDMSGRPVATVERDATPYESFNYLRELPRFVVITLFPINETTWLVMPFNLSDARQRGWKNGAPRSMYLVSENLNPMDIVSTRLLPPHSLIFDYYNIFGQMGEREFQIARTIYDQRLDAVRRQKAKAAREQALQTEQGRLQESLKFMGAELHDWERGLDGYTVRWEIDGQMYRTEIDTNLRVVSAGVCLAGTDDWHSLSSIVAAMQDRASQIAAGDHEDW